MSTASEQPGTDGSIAPGPGSDNFGHLLWETSARWMAYTEPRMGDHQLSFAATGALGRIASNPGVTASELAREAFKTQQAISQVTGRLERLGYVERRVGNGRGVGLYITGSGEKALAQGMRLEEALEDEARALLGDDLYATLKQRLRLARAAIADAS